MSIKCMNYVWEYSETTGADRLMLLALADSCNDDGEWSPGVARLAKKCKVTDRAAQYTLRRLEELGELEIRIGEGFPTKNGPTNKYIMKRYQQVKPVAGVQWTAPVGVQWTAPVGVKPVAPESSVLPISKTPVTAKRAQKSTAQPHPETQSIITAYIEVRGKNGINYQKEGTFAKKIAKDGYTPVQVKGCYLWLKAEPFWEDKPVTLDIIFKHLPEYGAWCEKNGITPTPGNGEPIESTFIWDEV